MGRHKVFSDEELRERKKQRALARYYRNKETILARDRAKRSAIASLRPPKLPRPKMSEDERKKRNRERNMVRRHTVFGQVPMAEYRAMRAAAKAARQQRIVAERQEAKVARASIRAARRETTKKPVRSDRTRELQKKWRLANLDRQRENIRRWKLANPDKVRSDRRARKIEKRRSLVNRLLKAQNGRCAYCKARLAGSNHHLDHVMPLKLGGPDEHSNLQLTCPPCNMAKGAKHPVDYARQRGMLL